MRPLAALASLAVVSLGIAVVALTADGCGGAEFELASTDAATDAATPADAPAPKADAPSDGSLPPSDASPPPAKDGAAAPDANEAGGTAGDAGDAGDAADAGDGSPAAFSCASLSAVDIVFCSDFDEPTKPAPQWNWSFELANGKGTLTDDTTDFVSPPNGFAASVPALLTGNATLTSLATTFASSAAHIDYVFEMFVKTYGGVGTAADPTVPIAQLEIGTAGTTPLFLSLALEGSQLHLVQSYAVSDGGQETGSSVVMGTVTTKEWVKVEMLLDRTATPWTVTVLLGGTSGLATPAAIMPSDPNVQVGLGIIEVVPPAAANAFTFDNVLVRAY